MAETNSFRPSSILRGAVLHGLGLTSIKERLMRRSYGVSSHPAFIQGVHDEKRKWVDTAGDVRCRDVMEWFATKVVPC